MCNTADQTRVVPIPSPARRCAVRRRWALWALALGVAVSPTAWYSAEYASRNALRVPAPAINMPAPAINITRTLAPVTQAGIFRWIRDLIREIRRRDARPGASMWPAGTSA